MGYTTYFNGEFKLDKPLFPPHKEILESLSRGMFLQPPPTASDQPDSWCGWIPSEDGTAIVWDEGEKFYNYVEWLDYIITRYLSPWGYVLNGDVSWEGEDCDDFGIILVENNKILIRMGTRDYEDPVPWKESSYSSPG